MNNDPNLRDLFRRNAATLFEEDGYRDYPHGGGSTDAGDLSQLMPVLHPVMAGAHGEPHSVDWHIADTANGYVSPAKTLAMMAVDLLADDAGTGRQVLEEFTPGMSGTNISRFRRTSSVPRFLTVRREADLEADAVVSSADRNRTYW